MSCIFQLFPFNLRHKHNKTATKRQSTLSFSKRQAKLTQNNTSTSQSAETKSTIESNPSGVPHEIGVNSSDAWDDVSLISCSTLLMRQMSHLGGTFSNVDDDVVVMEMMSDSRYQHWVNGGGGFGRSGSILTGKMTNMLGPRKDEDDDDDEMDGNETVSAFTRVSI